MKEYLSSYWIILFVSILSADLTFRFSLTRKIFWLNDTLLHEAGHAITSILTFHSPRTIKIFWNQSGVTETAYTISILGYFSRIITLLAGYPSGIFFGSLLILTPLVKQPFIVLGIFTCIGVLVLLLSRTLLSFILSIGLLISVYLSNLLLQSQDELYGVTLSIILGSILVFYSFKSIQNLSRNILNNDEEETDIHFLRDIIFVPKKVLLVIYWGIFVISPIGAFYFVHFLNFIYDFILSYL